MTNSEFLREFHKLQLDITYKELFFYPFGSLCYSVETQDPSENHCLCDRTLTAEELHVVEQKFRSLVRLPSFYLENTPKLSTLLKALSHEGYVKDWEDAWLFYPEKKVNLSQDIDVISVTTDEQLEIFLTTFSLCFQEGDPQNPHGSMNERLENIRQYWYVLLGTGRLEFFIFYQDKKPVATSALTIGNKIGYIDSVGSLREVRGQGFGKIATLYAVKRSMILNNTVHCLSTIEGTYPHEFYKRLGFEHSFSALGYVRR